MPVLETRDRHTAGRRRLHTHSRNALTVRQRLTNPNDPT